MQDLASEDSDRCLHIAVSVVRRGLGVQQVSAARTSPGQCV